jgi:NAD(P)-dependent dehydrogenase (short-subunit alcohol dehydrogenase family)
MRVKHKSIIVTGSGGGIGEGIAKRLAAEGAQVIVNDINADLDEKVVTEIVAAGGTASFFAADVTKSDDVKALVAAAVARYGKLDVMVNNAGWTHRNRPALEVSEDEFDKCYAVNVKSIYLATIHATPEFAGGPLTEERKDKFRASIPLGRFSTALDVANAALYLASDEAAFISGVCLEVDGARCV